MSEQLSVTSRADLHIHTNGSDGLYSPVDMVDVAASKGLGVIAITDHDTMEPAFVARNYANSHPNLGVEVIIGLEHSSDQGHLICLFPNLQDAIRLTNLPRQIRRAVDTVKDNGGRCIISHPGLPFIGVRLLNDIYPVIDGVEIFNGYCQFLRFIPLPLYVYPEDIKIAVYGTKVALIGSSDAHFSKAVGSAYTIFPGHSVEDLILAIDQRLTTPMLARNHPTFSDYFALSGHSLRKFGPVGMIRSILNRPFIKTKPFTN